MTAMPRDLAWKRSAEVATRRNEARTIDGKVVATRRGVSGIAMFRFLMLLLVACLFLGYLLSSI